METKEKGVKMKLHNVDIPDHYLLMMSRQCCQNCRCGGDPWNCVAMQILLVWRDANDNPSFHGNTEWECEGYEPKNKEIENSP